MSLPTIFRELSLGMGQLMYPGLCSSCEGRLESHMRFVCMGCRASLATLDLHRVPENEMTDRFWGRLPVARAAALLPYAKGLPAQRLMWLLKYDNRPQIGLNLGGWLGTLLAESDSFGRVDCIVPVPLHPLRERQRGYNQAERIATGIAEAIGAEVSSQAVQRGTSTSTQTRKSSFERVKNMENVFQLSPKPELNGKNVLLVDDVMTTGSTLEAVGLEIIKAQPASLKVATLALARRF